MFRRDGKLFAPSFLFRLYCEHRAVVHLETVSHSEFSIGVHYDHHV